jgi:hypothetical protein
MLQGMFGASVGALAGCGRECHTRADALEQELAALRRVAMHARGHARWVESAPPGDPPWDYRADLDSVWVLVQPSELPPLFVSVITQADARVDDDGSLAEGEMVLDVLRRRLDHVRQFDAARAPLIVAAHAGVPAASVRDVLAIAAGVSAGGRVDVVFRRQQALPLARRAPPPDLVAEDLALREGRSSPRREGPTIPERIFASCPLDLQPVATSPASERMEARHRQVAAAFRECGCRADEEAIVWSQQLLDLPDAPVGVLPLVRAARGVELSGATWLQAARTLLAAAEPRQDRGPLQPVAVVLAPIEL